MSKTKKNLSDRVTITDNPDFLEISISGKISAFQFSLLTAWLTGWSIAGIFVIIQLFDIQDNNLRVFMFVWLAFWVYFELRILHAWRWRKSGREHIVFRPDKTTINIEINKKSLPQYFQTSEISNIRNIELQKGVFIKNFYSSFWVVGGETIGFDYQNKQHSFGRQLSEEDANQILRKIKYKLEYWEKMNWETPGN